MTAFNPQLLNPSTTNSKLLSPKGSCTASWVLGILALVIVVQAVGNAVVIGMLGPLAKPYTAESSLVARRMDAKGSGGDFIGQ